MDGKHALRIPKSMLPQAANETKNFLADYFAGFQINSVCEEDDWLVELVRENFTYCEDFSLGKTPLHIIPSEYNTFQFSSNNQCICLSEAWIPYVWSKYITINRHQEKLTIIHVDDHADLMSPFIIWDNDKQFDMLTKRPISWTDPQSVKYAVQSGAITIGSMLTPIVMTANQVNVLHLKQNVQTVYKVLKKVTIDEGLLYPGAQRIAIERDEPYKKSHQNLYLKTSEYGMLKDYILPGSTVILHVDMDYFNNRYNGSTSWKIDGQSFDPPFDEQVSEMKKLGVLIGEVNSVTPVSCVYIGLSPSFYPVEFWKTGLSCLLDILSENSIDVSYIKDIFDKQFG